MSDPGVEVAEDEEAPTTKATLARTLNTLTVNFDHEPFGMPGVFTLTGLVTGDESVGVGARPDGVSFEFTGSRAPVEEAEASNDETYEDKDNGPPEDLGGYPFGPYSVAEIPEQGTLLITNATVWTVSDAGTFTRMVFSGSAPRGGCR